MEDNKRRIRRLFRRFVVMDMDMLESRLEGRSRRSVYRDLSEVGYLSSYSHAGRYYTLATIPDFDEDGLWFRQGVGFSRVGTLKETVAGLVEGADAGCLHHELESRLRVRVHNTLLGLVREQRIARERFGRRLLYVSVEADRRASQLDCRRSWVDRRGPAAPSLPTELVIAVLVEALHASEGLLPSAVVASRLAARGEAVTARQVQRVYLQHGLAAGKKRWSHADHARGAPAPRPDLGLSLSASGPRRGGGPGGGA